jgi:hypothetical protein
VPDWAIWLVAAALLAGGEVLSLGLFLGPLALAAILAALVALAGVAAALGTPVARRMMNLEGVDGAVVAVWAWIAGLAWGAVLYWLFGMLVHGAVRLLGSQGTFRRSRHIAGFAAAPIALSLLVYWPVRIVVYGTDLFRTGGDDYGAGDAAFGWVWLGFLAWALAFLVIGVRAVHGWTWGRALAAVALAAPRLLGPFARLWFHVGVAIHRVTGPIVPDEARRAPLRYTEEVVVDEHLPVAIRSGPDADRGDRHGLRDPRGDRRRHGFEHEREASRGFEGARVGEQPPCGFRRPALRLEAAERRLRLRRQPDVPHHRDPGRDDRLHARERRPGALELDDVRAALLDEADSGFDRLLVGDVVAPEGEVADNERPLRRTRDGACQEQHLVHGRGDGAVVTEHDHRGGVADEDEIDARVLGEPRPRRVVRGDHDDLLAVALHRGELRQRQLSSFHPSSPSRTTLSISRVSPTRTAAARTRGSKSASST